MKLDLNATTAAALSETIKVWLDSEERDILKELVSVPDADAALRLSMRLNAARNLSDKMAKASAEATRKAKNK